MLTAVDSFKVGFLSRCVEDRVPLTDIPSRVKLACEQLSLFEKSANPLLSTLSWLGSKGADLVGNIANRGADLGEKAISNGVGWGIPVALAAPPIAGYWAGHMLSRGTDMDDTDVGDIKHDELMDEYKRQTDKLRRQHLVRQYHRMKS
jgi:hypothetical protein